MNVQHAQEGSKIITPGKSYVNVTDGIFHQQCPANDPGKQFAEGGIGISVCTACHRDAAGKLGIAKSGKGTGDAAKNKQYDHPGTAGIDSATQAAETSGTNDGSDAKESKVTHCK